MCGKYMGINIPEISITCTIDGIPQDISGMLCVRERVKVRGSGNILCLFKSLQCSGPISVKCAAEIRFGFHTEIRPKYNIVDFSFCFILSRSRASVDNGHDGGGQRRCPRARRAPAARQCVPLRDLI